jgi:hypothetical protein
MLPFRAVMAALQPSLRRLRKLACVGGPISLIAQNIRASTPVVAGYVVNALVL